MTWNTTGGLEETNFINSKGLGSGGFRFYDMPSNTLNSFYNLFRILGYSQGG